jgi:hypothetical protein
MIWPSVSDRRLARRGSNGLNRKSEREPVSVNQPKAKLPRNQSPAYPTGRRLQMASDGNECAGRGLRCQSLAKEIATELRAKYDLKAACLPVNVCLLRSSIMIRAAPWEVLGTSAAAADRRAAGTVAACVPPSHRSASCTLAPRPPFNARVETVTTKPFFREPFTPRSLRTCPCKRQPNTS